MIERKTFTVIGRLESVDMAAGRATEERARQVEESRVNSVAVVWPHT